MRLNLLLLAVSRFGAGAAMMAFAGSLPSIMEAWKITATQAGTIQSAFNICYALSLFLASVCADRFGAKRVFLASAVATAIAYTAFCLWANSYSTALILYPIVGLAQGGTYTPSIMLVADNIPAERRGRAIGWLQAGASLGYFSTIIITICFSKLLGFQSGLWVVAVGPVLGAITATLALRKVANTIHSRPKRAELQFLSVLFTKTSLLLTVGYTAHCWEVLGMWAWMPTFLNSALSQSISNVFLLGILVAVPTHISGFVGTIMMGTASDVYGRKKILVSVAAIGALLSFLIGWLSELSAPVFLLISFVYGFALAGDSGVLSAAMTESTPASYLGTLFGLRSIFGFGAGAISPLLFGSVLDHTNPNGAMPSVWGWAFTTLAVGGLTAAACASFLPAKSKINSA